MSPLPTVWLNLRAQTNVALYIFKKLILKFNKLLKLTNKRHLVLTVCYILRILQGEGHKLTWENTIFFFKFFLYIISVKCDLLVKAAGQREG